MSASRKLILYLASVVILTLGTGAFVLIVNFALSFRYDMPVALADVNAQRKAISESMGEHLDWRDDKQILAQCGSCSPYINPADFNIPLPSVRPYSVRPNAKLPYCNELGFWKFIESDLYGFPNRDEERYFQSDVVLLGDSFGTSACVREHETISSNLIAGGLSVLTLAVGGFQPIDELASLKEYAPKHNALVWLYYEGNDAEKSLITDFSEKYLSPYYSQNLKAKPSEVSTALDVMEQEYRDKRAYRSRSTLRKLAAIVRDTKDSLLERLEWIFRPAISFAREQRGAREIKVDEDLLARTLTEGKRFSESRGARKFVLVYLPSWARYVWRPTNHPEVVAMDRLRKVVQEKAQLAGFKFVDLTQTFSDVGRSEIFPYDTHAHFTPKGYRIVADTIRDALN